MITTYISDCKCRCCGERLEAMSRPETTQTNSAGATRVIAASTVLTCKNDACTLYYQTFEISTYATEDLTVYGVKVAC